MSARVSMSSPLASACSGLMYAGVPTITPSSVVNAPSASRCSIALAIPKSMIVGTGCPSVTADQDVARLEVAVDHALLVRVLDALADAR